MRLLHITKYPPIQGGVSAGNYWLARGLGESGVGVRVITNAGEVEDDSRISIDFKDAYDHESFHPHNVSVSSLEGGAPRHLPYSPAYVSRLVNLGLEVLGTHGGDIIYAHYLEPYAVAGFILKKLTGLPLVIRHAGSDIFRLLKSPQFSLFHGRVIKDADHLIFSPRLTPLLESLDIPSRRIGSPPFALPEETFHPRGNNFNFSQYGVDLQKGAPVFTYMGKAGKHKGLHEILSALSSIEHDFTLILATDGPLRAELQKIAADSPSLKDKVHFLPFIPPWRVPELLRASTALLHCEYNFPIPIHSPRLPFEAIATGTPLILSREIYEKLQGRFPRTAQLFTIVDNPDDTKSFSEVLLRFFTDTAEARRGADDIRSEFLEHNDWNAYISQHVSLFSSLA